MLKTFSVFIASLYFTGTLFQHFNCRRLTTVRWPTAVAVFFTLSTIIFLPILAHPYSFSVWCLNHIGKKGNGERRVRFTPSITDIVEGVACICEDTLIRVKNMKCLVIGDGGWGSALAVLLDRNGHDVCVWGPFADIINEIGKTKENRKFLPGIELSDRIQWTADDREAAGDKELVIIAVPSQFYRDVLSRFRGLITASHTVISVTKGFDDQTLSTMSAIAGPLLEHPCIAALSGPSFAEEVAKNMPTAVVIACPEDERAELAQKCFSNDSFRAYTSKDVCGTELGGALKNVIAIAAGVSDGIGFGYNAKAALITRGLAEITRLGCTLGAKRETFSGLSGMGDLILTCTGTLSRNRHVGEQLGKGQRMDSILSDMVQVAEGVRTCRLAKRLGLNQGVATPVIDEVYALCYENKDPMQAVASLLGRHLKPEAE